MAVESCYKEERKKDILSIRIDRISILTRKHFTANDKMK